LDVVPPCYGRIVGRVRTRSLFECSECGQQMAQWAGRCPGCGAWGTIAERPERPPSSRGGGSGAVEPLAGVSGGHGPGRRVRTGLAGVDRVLGGGLVPASVTLLAGEPGIGKSTLLLHVVARLATAGLTCLYASGEESRDQVAARAARLGAEVGDVSFLPGRELPDVLDAARARRPFLVAVDSIQTVRDPGSSSPAGGPSQVRGCTDALIGLAKSEGITVLLTGHVTKEGDVAGPRTLEHAVDTVLSFEGDPRSGLRVLAGGKNRFGQEGEMAWFEMGPSGLVEAEPAGYLVPGGDASGSATALPLAGRRAFAVEVQALAVPTDGPPRRHVAGLDPRRFSMLAAVVERSGGIPLMRSELFGAASAGVRLDDPGCDLAIAAALASAARGRPPPANVGFVGEVSLTGRVRPVPGMAQRAAAARTAGVGTIVSAPCEETVEGVAIRAVADIGEALRWAGRRHTQHEDGDGPRPG